MGADWTAAIDVVMREAMLFAAAMFAIGGLDDLMVDLAYIRHRSAPRRLRDLPPAGPSPLAIFVPAWDERAVIGAMLRTTLARLDHPDYRILVGCYPNDRGTIDAVAAVAASDTRVRLVIGPHDGPTTKADCLNALWQALAADEHGAARQTRAVVLHDAEDVVHRDELRVVDALLDEGHAVVQLPVVPLIDPQARFVSGHYADEFAESHGRVLVVRGALGAALPLAGVGCAIRRDVLDALDAGAGPFEPASLTEDYELGLRIAALGHRGCFARVCDDDGEPVAVRAYFPATIDAAVRQKARWMTGIALAGWDRIGWGGRWRAAELWMRMRDRRAPLAVVALAAGYVALVGWAASAALHWLTGTPPRAIDPALAWVLRANAALLAWRLAVRAAATAHEHGWREGVLAVPRVFVSNLVALLAARRAVWRYLGMLVGRAQRWDKTAHRFPAPSAALAIERA